MEGKAAADDPLLSPFETCARIVGRRQKGRILSHLLEGETVFDDLCKSMPDLSSRSIKGQLRELEQDGVVVPRRVSPRKPDGIEYAVTELGHSLRPLVEMMKTWSQQYKEARVEHA